MKKLIIFFALAATGLSQIVPSSGNLRGPASATDNAIARFDGTTGKLVQNSNATITDAGAVAFASSIDAVSSVQYGLMATLLDNSGNAKGIIFREGASTGYKSAMYDAGDGVLVFYNQAGNSNFVAGDKTLTLGTDHNVTIHGTGTHQVGGSGSSVGFGTAAPRYTWHFVGTNKTLGIGQGVADGDTQLRFSYATGQGIIQVTKVAASNDTELVLQPDGGKIVFGTSSTPASASATGTAGTILWDANYVYVCVATNTWKRAAIATW